MPDEIQKAAETTSAAGGIGGVAAIVTAFAAGTATVLRAIGASGKVKALAERVEKLEGRADDHDSELGALRGAVAAASAAAPTSARSNTRPRIPPAVDRRLDDLEAWRARMDRERAAEVAVTAGRFERLTGLIEGLTTMIRGGGSR